MSGCAVIGMSCMKRLNRNDESTKLCGTPIGKRLFVDGVPNNYFFILDLNETHHTNCDLFEKYALTNFELALCIPYLS